MMSASVDQGASHERFERFGGGLLWRDGMCCGQQEQSSDRGGNAEHAEEYFLKKRKPA
jgi:hypothetical protein